MSGDDGLSRMLVNLELGKLDPQHPDVAEVSRLATLVDDALSSPKALAFAVEELELARRGLVPPIDDLADAYMEAAIQLARERGYQVIELSLTADRQVVLTNRATGAVRPLAATPEGLVKRKVFLEEVVGSGAMFIDRAALTVTKSGSHGALTHFIQDLAVDTVLKEHGSSSVEFRRLLKEINEWARGKRIRSVRPGSATGRKRFDSRAAGDPEPGRPLGEVARDPRDRARKL